MTQVLAIDIGGTFIKSAIVDVTHGLPSTVSNVSRTPTAVGSEDGHKLMAQLLRIGNEAKTSAEFSAIGVITPGLLDEERGVIRYATNLHVRDLDMREQLESALNLPVGFGHDGRACALAEHLAGAAQGLDNFALMPIGTGISVGLVIDGQLPSSDGFIGEIGHANTGHSVKCECGLVGCFEAVASTASIARRYHAATGTAVDAKFVVDASARGDAVAAGIWNDALDSIAIACDWLMNTLSPEAIVFAGGLSAAGERLVAPIDERLGQRISFQRRPKLKLALLGDDAGILGSAALALKAADR